MTFQKVFTRWFGFQKVFKSRSKGVLACKGVQKGGKVATRVRNWLFSLRRVLESWLHPVGTFRESYENYLFLRNIFFGQPVNNGQQETVHLLTNNLSCGKHIRRPRWRVHAALFLLVWQAEGLKNRVDHNGQQTRWPGWERLRLFYFDCLREFAECWRQSWN